LYTKSELPKYIFFDKILCNNQLCQDKFNINGYNNTTLVEYTPIDSRLKFKKKDLRFGDGTKLKFLILGGLNAVVRKQIILVCKSFKSVLEYVSNIELIVCIQGSQIPKELTEFTNVPGIFIEIKHYTYGEIIKKYQTTHINIQVSKHEGLGLGFYESIATGTPVLTLDTAPHNEIIINGVNGWYIKCEYEDMNDNTDGLVQSAIFKQNDLESKIEFLAKNLSEVTSIIKNVKKNFDKRFNAETISNKFLDVFIN